MAKCRWAMMAGSLALACLVGAGFQLNADLFQKALSLERSGGDIKGAMALYKQIVEKSDDESLAAQAQLRIGFCYEKLGMQEARKAFELVLSKYPNQTEAVKAARERLSALPGSQTEIENSNKEFRIRKVGDVGVFGAVSPDGRYLSYMDWETYDLAIYEIATGNKRRLTKRGSPDQSEGLAQFSRWSPDSRQVVYDWVDNEGYSELSIVGLDGSKPRILYNHKGNISAQAFDWSPDGKQILAGLETNRGQNQIVLISTADGSMRVLKTMEQEWLYHMNFSPDGRYVVYDYSQTKDSLERDISLLPIDGSREIPLVQHPADDYVLGWAPDGIHILFASDRRNSLDVWVIQFSDGKAQGSPKLVKTNIEQIEPLGFTRNGSFYYGITNPAYDIYSAELDPETGKLAAPPQKQNMRLEGSFYQPEYSPDGRAIAYISVPTNRSALMIQSLETGKTREFPLKSIRRVNCPRWSPDGLTLLVGGWDLKGKYGIWRVDPQSGLFALLVPAPPDGENWATTHEWSHDGKALFLARNANQPPYQTRIMRRDLESGAEEELYRGAPGMFSLSCSPDGRWLAFLRRGKDGLLGILPASGGKPRELYAFMQEDQKYVPLRWAPDGKSLFFEIIEPGQKKWSLWRIPMEGGEPRKLGLEWDALISASFHPDGRHIVFSAPGSKSEYSGNWVMENFLPPLKAVR